MLDTAPIYFSIYFVSSVCFLPSTSLGISRVFTVVQNKSNIIMCHKIEKELIESIISCCVSVSYRIDSFLFF